MGWCAVEPRPHDEGLVRVFRVPWDGRDEGRTDAGVWAITCLFTRAGFRQGVSLAIATAAGTFARDRGAAAVEAYPTLVRSAGSDEQHVGSVATFTQAGLREVHRPTPRRVVVRLDLDRV